MKFSAEESGSGEGKVEAGLKFLVTEAFIASVKSVKRTPLAGSPLSVGDSTFWRNTTARSRNLSPRCRRDNSCRSKIRLGFLSTSPSPQKCRWSANKSNEPTWLPNEQAPFASSQPIGIIGRNQRFTAAPAEDEFCRVGTLLGSQPRFFSAILRFCDPEKS